MGGGGAEIVCLLVPPGVFAFRGGNPLLVDRWVSCPPVGLGLRRAGSKKTARGGHPVGLPNSRATQQLRKNYFDCVKRESGTVVPLLTSAASATGVPPMLAPAPHKVFPKTVTFVVLSTSAVGNVTRGRGFRITGGRLGWLGLGWVGTVGTAGPGVRSCTALVPNPGCPIPRLNIQPPWTMIWHLCAGDAVMVPVGGRQGAWCVLGALGPRCGGLGSTTLSPLGEKRAMATQPPGHRDMLPSCPTTATAEPGRNNTP